MSSPKEVPQDEATYIVEEASIIATNYALTASTKAFRTFQDVIDGKTNLNHDAKRVLCNDVNFWLAYYLESDSDEQACYSLDSEGNITVGKRQLPPWKPDEYLDQQYYTGEDDTV